MRLFRWFSLFTVIAILLSGCASKNAAARAEENSAQPAEVNPINVVLSQVRQQVAAAAEPNECLNCHSDKDRLIETADPVTAPAESESSGVG